MIITGAGASKSLTQSLPTEKQTVSGFRELPTGHELVQQIGRYEHKSRIWLVAYFCYCHFNVDTNSDNFVNFAAQIEDFKHSYDRILQEAGDRYREMSDQSKYGQYIQDEIVKIQSLTREWAEKLQQRDDHSTPIIIGNDNKRQISKLLKNSKFLKDLVGELSNNSEVPPYTWWVAFSDGFANLIFIKLISSVNISSPTILNSIITINEKYPKLLDLLLKHMFYNVKEIIHLFIDDNRVTSNYNNPRRVNGMNIISNSVYKSREDCYDGMIKDVMDKLRQYHCFSDSALQDSLTETIEQLRGFKDVLCSLIEKPPQVFGRQLGQSVSAREFNGFFDIEITDEHNGVHNITAATVQKVSDCIDNLTIELDNLKTFPDNKICIVNTIIKILDGNGFKYAHKHTELLDKVNVLMIKIIALLRNYVFDYKTLHPGRSRDSLEEKIAHVISDMKGCYLAASVVGYYKPYSIDYFMMNIKSLAPYEFSDIKDNESKQSDRINSIQRYTKLLMANILMGHLSFVYRARNNDNYLQRLLWRVQEYAHCYGKTLKECMLENVQVINFNYELSLLLMLYDLLPVETVNAFYDKNVSHMYGSLYLTQDIYDHVQTTTQDNKHLPCRYECNDNAIWNALFKFDDNGNYLSIMDYPYTHRDHKRFHCKNMLKQISTRLQWIGESTEAEDRNNYQQLITWADEIYFLGFGFDMNNLYNLGLIDKKHKIEKDIFEKDCHTRKIFISGGSAKIINTLKDTFEIETQEVVADVYHLKKQDIKLEIYVSSKHLPEALITDL